MSKSSVHDRTGVFQGNFTPACQWSFNRAQEFHHVSGDSQAIFALPPAELIRKPVFLIDDSARSWSKRLDRAFSGGTPIEQWTDARPGGEYVLAHVPVHAHDGSVRYIAGFAFPTGSPAPAPAELELAASAALQCVETERTRANRFLHDVVAQSLSGAGLQLELLQLELGPRKTSALERVSQIQQSLDELLRLLREFNAPE